MKYLLIILILLGCKKETTKPEEPITYKQLSYSGSGFANSNITLNGISKSIPFEVKAGDKVYVLFQAQVSTPKNYDVRVSVTLDGSIIGSCYGCNKYEETFTIK